MKILVGHISLLAILFSFALKADNKKDRFIDKMKSAVFQLIIYKNGKYEKRATVTNTDRGLILSYHAFEEIYKKRPGYTFRIVTRDGKDLKNIRLGGCYEKGKTRTDICVLKANTQGYPKFWFSPHKRSMATSKRDYVFVGMCKEEDWVHRYLQILGMRKNFEEDYATVHQTGYTYIDKSISIKYMGATSYYKATWFDCKGGSGGAIFEVGSYDLIGIQELKMNEEKYTVLIPANEVMAYISSLTSYTPIDKSLLASESIESSNMEGIFKGWRKGSL